MSNLPGSTISAILRHDSKVTSYKIALLRAINDVVLAFPDLASMEQAAAIPLSMLADRWIAYYWPFVDPQVPILQGPTSQRDGQLRQDMSFRSELTRLYAAWEQFIGSSAQPSDGSLLVADLRVERLRNRCASCAPIHARMERHRCGCSQSWGSLVSARCSIRRTVW